MGRLVHAFPQHLGHISDGNTEMAEISKRTFQDMLDELKPRVRAHDVYAIWQAVVDDANKPDYRHRHCGYLMDICFPPS